MKRVLILSPHFPPDTGAASHRMRLLAPRLGPGERQHRAEITAIRAAWQLRVDRARRLPRTIASSR